MRTFIIQDWAGNILNYKGLIQSPSFSVPMEFETFDDASSWLCEKYGDDEDSLSEYHIEEKK